MGIAFFNYGEFAIIKILLLISQIRKTALNSKKNQRKLTEWLPKQKVNPSVFFRASE